MRLENSPTVTIPEDAWEDWSDYEGETSEQGSRLGTHIVINGIYFHVEAIEVEETDESIQEAKDAAWQESFDSYYAAAGADGGVNTMTIRGREYAVFLSPFC